MNRKNTNNATIERVQDVDFALKQKISIIMEIDKLLSTGNNPSVAYFFTGYRGSCAFKKIISSIDIDDIHRLFSKIYSLGVGNRDEFTKEDIDATISSICEEYRYTIPNENEISVIYDIFIRYGAILDLGVFEIIHLLDNMVYMEHEPFINVYHKLVMDHDADISYGREFADVVIAIILYDSHKKGDSERFKLMCKRFNLSYMISHLHVDIREFIEEEISGDILSEIQREFHEYIIG